MSKKNKKIKMNCPHCGKRNKFAKNNWKGVEKTKCKSCGKILSNTKQPNVKEYEIPVTNLDSKKHSPKESFNKATRPSLNIAKEKEGKSWVLVIIFGCLICFGAYIYEQRDMNTLNEILDELNKSDLTPPTTQELCSNIQGVPAWIQDNEIIDYGYKPNWDVPYLVKNKIYFLYSATCSVCHKQILNFGDEWALYIMNGYTQKCW